MSLTFFAAIDRLPTRIMLHIILATAALGLTVRRAQKVVGVARATSVLESEAAAWWDRP